MNNAPTAITNGYSNPKVNAIVYGLGVPLNEFTATDWRDLAMACIDQAGVTGRAYDRIEAILAEVEETQPTGT